MIFEVLDYRTEQPIRIELKGGKISHISKCMKDLPANHYIAPGLVDLQINGFKGVDFNTVGLQVSDILMLTNILLEKGITRYFPTIITNSDESVESLIEIIVFACESNSK